MENKSKNNNNSSNSLVFGRWPQTKNTKTVILAVLTEEAVPRYNGVMDSAVACSIPAVGISKSQYSDVFWHKEVG